jgi:hypothetical protein
MLIKLVLLGMPILRLLQLLMEEMIPELLLELRKLGIYFSFSWDYFNCDVGSTGYARNDEMRPVQLVLIKLVLVRLRRPLLVMLFQLLLYCSGNCWKWSSSCCCWEFF